MVACAQVAHYARSASKWGVQVPEVSVDFAKIMDLKDQLVHRFRSGLEEQVERHENLHLYRGHARFTGPQQVRVGQEALEAEKIFINTGARPAIPALDGLDDIDYLTNLSLMELQELPEHLLVIGGGYIGLEFGQMFHRFGSRVTIVQRADQLAPCEDADVAEALRQALEAEGVRIILNAAAQRVDKSHDGLHLTLSSGGNAGGRSETLTGSHLLIAAGRVPNSDDLGLDEAGVEVNERGAILVNDRLETNVPGIWALGDVNGGPSFTHVSYDDYLIVADNLLADPLNGGTRSANGRIVPYSMFTDPQLGRVGLTEKEARASGYRLKIGSIPMSWVARAMERNETAGLMKLIVDADDDRILGAAVLSVEGGEVVQLLHVMMLAGAPYTLLKGAIFIHPTLAEGLYTLMDHVKLAE